MNYLYRLAGLALVFGVSVLSTAGLSAAPKKGKDGYYNTGYGVRYKKILFVSVKVYGIQHKMRALPANKSKRAMINADVDKKFVLRMLRTVEASKIGGAVRDAFHKNGYRNNAKINRMLSLLKGDAKNGSYLVISYSAKSKTTRLYFKGRSRSIKGVDFMKGMWSVWFGKIDQPSLSRRLMSRL